MKKIVIITLFASNIALGQSTKIEPGANGFVSLPSVSVLSSCGVSDKGKMVFLTTDNKFYFCNGMAWSANSFSLPFNQTISHGTNYDGGTFKITNSFPSSESVAIHGSITGNDGYAIRATALNTSGFNTGAIWATNSSTNSNGHGILGSHYGGGTGVSGGSSSGKGISGTSYSGLGGYFSSTSGYSLVTEEGKVGIGILSPNLNTGEIIDINGRARIRQVNPNNTAGIWFNNSLNNIGSGDGAFFGIETATAGSERAGIYIGNAWRFYINRSGNANFAGTVTASCGLLVCSDLRYKKNIIPLENSLANVLKINGVSYDFRQNEFPEKNFSDKNQIGLIAQEIEKIFPEMVFTDEKGFKSVDYARLTPVLVEAIKELTAKNGKLESRLDKIEALLSK